MEVMMAVQTELNLKELEAMIDKVFALRFQNTTQPPSNWLPEFFETFGSFQNTPIVRDEQTASDVRLELQ
jgi:hypothetical protein